jgi:hypothetical protein
VIDLLGGSHAFALSSCVVSFRLPSPRMGSARAALLLLLLEERGLVEIGTFQPSLGFKDFRRAARLPSPTNGQFGGEKRAGLRPLPRPQLQGFSSSGLRQRSAPSGGLPPHGPVTLFFPQRLGEKGILQPHGGFLQPCGGRRTAAVGVGGGEPLGVHRPAGLLVWRLFIPAGTEPESHL